MLLAASAILLLQRRNKASLGDESEPVASCNLQNLMRHFIGPSVNVVCGALDCLAGGRVIDACKNHRVGTASLSELEKKLGKLTQAKDAKEDMAVVYVKYMIEAAGKVAETVCHIVVRPEFCISISDKCELQTIGTMIGALPAEVADDSRFLSKVANDKDFIEHLIAEKSKSMTHEDFDDGSQAYSYLVMLYYLHSYLNSFYQIVSASAKYGGVLLRRDLA